MHKNMTKKKTDRIHVKLLNTPSSCQCMADLKHQRPMLSVTDASYRPTFSVLDASFISFHLKSKLSKGVAKEEKRVP